MKTAQDKNEMNRALGHLCAPPEDGEMIEMTLSSGHRIRNILRNIMKTAQDSYTITIKQIVRFQERMHFEENQLNHIQNGRLSAIIHLDRPDIE